MKTKDELALRGYLAAVSIVRPVMWLLPTPYAPGGLVMLRSFESVTVFLLLLDTLPGVPGYGRSLFLPVMASRFNSSWLKSASAS